MTSDFQLKAPCGCRLLFNVNAQGVSWGLQAPCKPSKWGDWNHLYEASVALGMVIRLTKKYVDEPGLPWCNCGGEFQLSL